MMSRAKRVVVCALVVGTLGIVTPSANAVPRWAPASKATIRPGVRTFVSGSQCRASFVFHDGTDVFLGQPGHCSSSVPLGTPIKIDGASRPGTHVYNSWRTMDRVLEDDQFALRFNDFALVRVHKADRGKVNPSVPFWGGPTGAGARSALGDPVYSYGNSEVYCWETGNCRSSAEVDQLSPRVGIDTSSRLMPTVPWGGLRSGNDTDGWIRYIHTLSPGISGGRGGAVLDQRGRALGILGWPGYDLSDRVTDLAKAMRYMKAKTTLDAIMLAEGTEPFLADVP